MKKKKLLLKLESFSLLHLRAADKAGELAREREIVRAKLNK